MKDIEQQEEELNKIINLFYVEKKDENSLLDDLKKTYAELFLSEYDNEQKKNASNIILLKAIREEYLDIFKFALENGADVNTKSFNNWTPLHFAASYNQAEIVKLLLSKGANVYALTVNSFQTTPVTPLEVAKKVNDAQTGYERDRMDFSNIITILENHMKKDPEKWNDFILGSKSGSEHYSPSYGSNNPSYSSSPSYDSTSNNNYVPYNSSSNNNVPYDNSRKYPYGDSRNNRENSNKNNNLLNNNSNPRLDSSESKKSNALFTALFVLSATIAVATAVIYFIPKLQNTVKNALGNFALKHLGKIAIALEIVAIPVFAISCFKLFDKSNSPSTDHTSQNRQNGTLSK